MDKENRFRPDESDYVNRRMISLFRQFHARDISIETLGRNVETWEKLVAKSGEKRLLGTHFNFSKIFCICTIEILFQGF